MKIINLLPIQLECLKRWETIPTLEIFRNELFEKIRPYFEEAIGNAEEIYEYFKDPNLNWETYRSQALLINEEIELKRIKDNLNKVEDFFHLKLEGEIVIFAMFHYIDGYARFHKGTHRVFIGLCTEHQNNHYYDILETHELTHVARESRVETWHGWGIPHNLSNEEFVENQPVLEHLFGEGFSCLVSQILNPSFAEWEYVYQTQESFEMILNHAEEVNRVMYEQIKLEESKPEEADYFKLYHSEHYNPPLPLFTQYVWAKAWVETLIKERPAQELLTKCSLDFRIKALNFKLTKRL